jgi:hypothetical protein
MARWREATRRTRNDYMIMPDSIPLRISDNNLRHNQRTNKIPMRQLNFLSSLQFLNQTVQYVIKTYMLPLQLMVIKLTFKEYRVYYFMTLLNQFWNEKNQNIQCLKQLQICGSLKRCIDRLDKREHGSEFYHFDDQEAQLVCLIMLKA